MKFSPIAFLQSALIVGAAYGQTEAPAWLDFTRGQANNQPTILPDYSYSGYQFSEKPIPDTSAWKHIVVTDYGAIPDDNLMDDEGIQAALDAAHAIAEPVVVLFPKGKYVVGTGKRRNDSFRIQRGHILLKGEGPEEGGTEIYTHEHPEQDSGSGDRFEIRPDKAKYEKPDETILANVSGVLPRGSFTIKVDDTSKLKVGQYVTFFHQSTEAITATLGGLEFSPDWKTGTAGIRIHEEHLITAIKGKNVTFKNPIQIGIPDGAGKTQLWPYSPIEEIGIEGIRFSSGWKNYPQEFKHHLNWEVDYAYRALHLTNVTNSWIRNCVFSDWNEGIKIDSGLATTVENVRFTGKPGHATAYARNSYGILFSGIVNETPNWHGLGFRWATTSTVYQNCTMLEDQSIDCHGFHPYSNLVDNVKGGRFSHNGGNWGSYPNSGPFFTFWNFTHNASAEQTDYDFWSPKIRKLHNYVRPLFVGFRSPGETVTFEDEGLDELRNEEAYPKSLFEAQLQLRLYDSYVSASSEAPGHSARFANDNDPSTSWISDREAANQWLQIDLGIDRKVSGVLIHDSHSTVSSYIVEAWSADGWVAVAKGETIGPNREVTFKPTTTRKLRLFFPPAEPRDTIASIAGFKPILEK